MSERNFKDGKGYIVSSSHNDIAWFNTPYKTMEYRDDVIITPAIKEIDEDRNFKHTMECTLYLYEYLNRQPEKREKLKKLACDNRLLWGATFSQPYEHMLNDEALVRQTYYGKRWFEEIFKGAKANVAWSPDVPGRAMQMPQILKKAGIDYLIISRIDCGAFEWVSPDGSSVKGFSNGHYFNGDKAIDFKTVDEALNQTAELLEGALPFYEEHKLPLTYLFLSVEDYAKPKNYKYMIDMWPEKKPSNIPALEQSTIVDFMDALTSDKNSQFVKYHGDRPDEWAYIHGATHHEALYYGRRASDFLPQAEAFEVFNCLLERNFSSYPTAKIDKAWRNLLYADHGFGGVNGHITDKVFKNSMKCAYDLSNEMLSSSLEKIADKVKTKDIGKPIVVFNKKGYTRTDLVTLDVDLTTVGAPYFRIVDKDLNDVDFQIVDEKIAFSLTISFKATVKAFGYETFYLVKSDEKFKNIWLKDTAILQEWRLHEHPNKEEKLLIAQAQEIENEFYKIKFSKGGIDSIFDKELQKELVDSSDYKCFEIFSMKSEGTGAGEFSEIQKATLDYSDCLKNYDTKWEIIEDGSVLTKLSTNVHFDHCYVTLTVSVYNSIKKLGVDVLIESFDGHPYIEYRMAVPTTLKNPQVAYDTVMGTIEVSKDEIQEPVGTKFFKSVYNISYPVAPCDTHPREMQNFVSMEKDGVCVLLSNDVSLVDYVNPKDSSKTLLAPILLASRRSCHWQGNVYDQKGTHSFHFAYTTAKGGYRDNKNIQKVEGENTPLCAITNFCSIKKERILPESLSFFSQDCDNLVISAIKKACDSDDVVLRTYENFGQVAKLNLNSYFKVKGTEKVSLIEYPLENKDMSLNISPRSIDTFKLKF